MMSGSNAKDEFTFSWKIENFSMLPLRSGDSLTSAVFTVRMLNNSELYLVLYPKGEKNKDGRSSDKRQRCNPSEGFISCYLKSKTWNNSSLDICFSFTLESTEESLAKCEAYSMHSSSFKDHRISAVCQKLFPISMIIENKHLYLPQDIFTLTFSMWPFHKIYATPTNNYKPAIIPNLSNDYCCSVTRFKVEKKSITWPVTKIDKLVGTNGTTSFNLTSVLKDSPSLELTLRLNKESVQSFSPDNDDDEESDEELNNESDENSTEEGNDVSSQDEEGVQNSDEKYSDVEIRRTQLSSNEECLFVRCQMTVLSGDKNYQDSKEDAYLFGSDKEEKWHFPAFIKTKNLVNDKYIYVDDTLLLQCNFEFFRKSSLYNVEFQEYVLWNFQKTKESKFKDLTSSMRDMFLNKKFSDVRIQVGSEHFPAHKVVLSARSPVFSAMFEVEMKETTTNIVDIPDVEPATLVKFLKFLYTDILEEDMTVEDTCKLYSVADKYQVMRLKQQCSVLLLSELSTENACDVLVLADTHNDPFLLLIVHDFLRSHTTETFHSAEWKSCRELYPKLFGDTMIKILMGE